MFEALLMAISPTYLMYMTIGVLLGLVVGTLPGLTATMGTALLVPFTFGLPTGEGIAMLGGLYVCAMFSDAIPACLVNTPGTPAAMATGFDGHPMVKQGRGKRLLWQLALVLLWAPYLVPLATYYLHGLWYLLH